MICDLSLKSRDHKIQNEFHLSTFELQTVSVALDGRKRTIIVNVHRPPYTSTAGFMDEFAELVLQLVSSVGSSFMIVGDLNLPGAAQGEPDNNFTDLLYHLGLEQLVSAPTRVNNLLDLIIIPAKTIVIVSLTLLFMTSRSPVTCLI